jgi:hypothetical protein
MSAWRRCVVCARGGFLLIGLLGLAGCVTTEGGPDRLYTPAVEVAQAQAKLPELESDYYNPPQGVDPKTYWGSDAQKWYRNEYIARRMYIIDVEYSAYEAALTSERQKYGFATDMAALTLGTAGALTPPGVTARALSLSSTALSTTTGLYDKDLIIAKTIQIVEADMRAQRLTVATTILQRRSEPTTTYPLSAALSDLEQYYLAGTMNSGLIVAAKDAGNNEANAAAIKAVSLTYAPITDLGKRILAYSQANPDKVRKWLDTYGGGEPLSAFIHSAATNLLQKMINDLSIP